MGTCYECKMDTVNETVNMAIFHKLICSDSVYLS